MFWRGGLPKPLSQYAVVDGHGRTVARLDFAWPEFGVFLEFDGKEKYTKYLKEGESVVDAVLREKKREELDLPPHRLALHSPHLGATYIDLTKR